jgi:hypothetical protein
MRIDLNRIINLLPYTIFIKEYILNHIEVYTKIVKKESKLV